MSIQLQIPSLAAEDSGRVEHAPSTEHANGARKPRDYQGRIISQALDLIRQGKSPLTVAACGTGKTFIASSVIHQCGLRTLWLVHRIELVHQAIRALEEALGEAVGVELPGRFSGRERVVVCSKDTVRTKARLNRLKDLGTFGLLSFDEAHHSEAMSYQSIVRAFPDAQRFGFTATPGRMDERKLSLFNAATDPFGIAAAIDQGYLVPIKAERVSVKSVDLSGVSTVAGDLDRQQLSDIMVSERNLHAVSQAVLERQNNWPGLIFSPSVDCADRVAEVINRNRPGTARFVSGKTPPDERKWLFDNLGKQYQILANYGIATEGTDLVNVKSVFMQRPTKSTPLFQQMLGRPMRPLPGSVDGPADAAARKQSIANSAKPYALVVDFVGVTGRHTVATAMDVLAGEDDIPAEVVQRTKSRLEKGEILDVASVIAEEIEAKAGRDRKREAERARRLAATSRQAIVGTVSLSARATRIVGLGGSPEETGLGSIWDGPPLPGQVNELQRLGLSGHYRTAREAREAISRTRSRLSLATPKQVLFVEKHKPRLARPDLTKKDAARIISQTIREWNR